MCDAAHAVATSGKLLHTGPHTGIGHALCINNRKSAHGYRSELSKQKSAWHVICAGAKAHRRTASVRHQTGCRNKLTCPGGMMSQCRAQDPSHHSGPGQQVQTRPLLQGQHALLLHHHLQPQQHHLEARHTSTNSGFVCQLTPGCMS